MSASAPEPTIAKPSRISIRLPHWGWVLLVTAVLVFVYGALSVWLPYYREQQVLQKIKRWDGTAKTEICCPEWLKKFVGKDRMLRFRIFNRINVIYLSEPAITDAEIADLSGLKYLEVLSLDGTKVTDAGLVRLSGMTKLVILRLRSTRVGDAGLAHLTGLKNLKVLDLCETAVTDKGIDELQKALPGCKIHTELDWIIPMGE